jgi:RNA polymerase sigma-70 factor, ECF subfamily
MATNGGCPAPARESAAVALRHRSALSAQRAAGSGPAGRPAVRIADAFAVEATADSLEPDLVALRVDLSAAWRGLRPEEQEVLALRVFENLTSAQAARVLGITSAAYRLRLMRVRNALRRRLERPDPESTCPTAPQETSP